ncbi:DUF4169 family protein [Yoonia sp. BS5-3]|uniref:DUF4169 family protein n=1 Tax=Yoonia phaeophyticola TaxID=3137369 RepID=A0ABZ2V1S7_9RHOB
MKPVNLNKVRKAKNRADAKAKADQNAIRFGRTKAERVLDAAKVKQANDRLSAMKFEDE